MFSKIKRNHLWFLVCNRPNLSAKHSCSSGNQCDMKHRRLLLLNSSWVDWYHVTQVFRHLQGQSTYT